MVDKAHLDSGSLETKLSLSSTARERPSAFFTADDPSLDFANTFSTPAGVETDWLTSGEDLFDWLAQTDFVPPEALDKIREGALPGQLDAVAAQSRALRDWFRRFVLAHKDRSLKPAAFDELGPLNKILERDDEFWQIELVNDGRGARKKPKLKLVARRRWRSPDDLLFPLARSMSRFICEADFKDVHMCEGRNCTLLFVDKTRARGRRWCSMALCGNRAKQAAHRARLKVA